MDTSDTSMPANAEHFLEKVDERARNFKLQGNDLQINNCATVPDVT